MIRNLHCLLADGYIGVTEHCPHPEGGWYMVAAWCYGREGRVGYWMDA